MSLPCCKNQIFERHPDAKIADIGKSDSLEFTVGRCKNCNTPLIHCYVAGGVSEGIEVVSQELIHSFLDESDLRLRKKLLVHWFDGLG